MGLHSSLIQLHNDFADSFSPTIPIHNWVFGLGTNTANLEGNTAVMLFPKGSVDRDSFSTSVTTITGFLYIKNVQSDTQQNDLLLYLDEVVSFIQESNRLGGVEMVEVSGWDWSVSDDGIAEGVLAVELQVIAQF